MKILIAHWQFLQPDTNSGDLRLYEIIKILKKLGHQVFFLHPGFKTNKYLTELGIATPMDLQTAIESSHKFRFFLLWNRFDVAILSPYSTFDVLEQNIKRTIPKCSLILDTIDLFHIRTQRQADLTRCNKDMEEARQIYHAEWKCLRTTDSAWVVTEPEQKIIASTVRDVHVISNIHRVASEIRPFKKREGIVFLGGHGHSPNIDAVKYFVLDVLPFIRRALPNVLIIIAGNNPPELYYDLASKFNLIITGYIADHRAILQSSRVAVAPLRYGAGMKGKIGEYLSCGTPCVSTTIGAEGMNLLNGETALIADDPLSFADDVIRLYNDEILWNKISKNGLEYIEDNLSPNAITGLLDNALEQSILNNSRRNHSKTYHYLNFIKSLVIITGSKMKELMKL